MRRKQVRVTSRAHSERWTPCKTGKESTHDETGEILAEPCSEREQHEDRRRKQVYDLSTVLLAQGSGHDGSKAQTERVDCDAY